ncbi:MAG: pyruvate kinase, partial [Bacteroidales bacterium]|nr:pyruvate kinase [Bacteroidales bacterium]
MKPKKTKIVATISDQNCSIPFIQSLFEAGMNVARINSAHLTLQDAGQIVANIRAVSDTIAILIDTKGPEIRLTSTVDNQGIEVKTGDSLLFGGNPEQLSSGNTLYANDSHFVNSVPIGASILIDDGDIALTVAEKKEGFLHCIARNNGIIYGRKSINVPNVPIQLPSVSEKDKQFLRWAMDEDLDFVAHSFVRNRQDIQEVQSILDTRNNHMKIIAKIENQQGVDNLDEILDLAYGVMVARGDLGVEIEAEKIPVIQRKIIHTCRIRRKPVIIATQMLHSMIEHPRPTRAEVSDVANAIYQHSDAIMLSGETAKGKYPVEAVETMTRIALEIESYLAPTLDIALSHVTEPIAAVLAKSVVDASTRL